MKKSNAEVHESTIESVVETLKGLTEFQNKDNPVIPGYSVESVNPPEDTSQVGRWDRWTVTFKENKFWWPKRVTHGLGILSHKDDPNHELRTRQFASWFEKFDIEVVE